LLQQHHSRTGDRQGLGARDVDRMVRLVKIDEIVTIHETRRDALANIQSEQ
jgi:hypothetical protein